MIRILLDEGLPLRAAQRLRDLGIDALHAREAGLAAAEDTRLIEFARDEARVCFTLDHDFHAILAETVASTPSVVLLRVQQAEYVEISDLIARLIREYSAQLAEGVALTANKRGVRLRRLPLR
jgi:predicted nuclease of predicted toxin-antitoxin system